MTTGPAVLPAFFLPRDAAPLARPSPDRVLGTARGTNAHSYPQRRLQVRGFGVDNANARTGGGTSGMVPSPVHTSKRPETPVPARAGATIHAVHVPTDTTTVLLNYTMTARH